MPCFPRGAGDVREDGRGEVRPEIVRRRPRPQGPSLRAPRSGPSIRPLDSISREDRLSGGVGGLQCRLEGGPEHLKNLLLEERGGRQAVAPGAAAASPNDRLSPDLAMQVARSAIVSSVAVPRDRRHGRRSSPPASCCSPRPDGPRWCDSGRPRQNRTLLRSSGNGFRGREASSRSAASLSAYRGFGGLGLWAHQGFGAEMPKPDRMIRWWPVARASRVVSCAGPQIAMSRSARR